MAARERMQVARRHDPYPWTWEPFALWALMLLMVLLLGVQVGRGLANWFSGAGFTWPPSENVVTSIFGVIGGDPAAGLDRPHQLGHVASTDRLHGWLIGTEVLLLVAYGVATFYVLRTWGPWRVLGMASREEAERLLGRTRLRKVAGVVRPDLYGSKQSTAARQVVYRDAEPMLEVGSSPLGRGLSKRLLPRGNSDGIAPTVNVEKTQNTEKTRTWL
jgi:hypothetical protein